MIIHFQKVKGHSGDEYNDLADELAKSVIFSVCHCFFAEIQL
ncbi:MAG: hypothetical protein ACLSD6_01320 [Clostridium sp.]